MNYCDWSCVYASFPKKKYLDGACKTFQAVYCKKKKVLVLKNKPCITYKERK